MASQQELKEEISAETGTMLKCLLKDGNEICSSNNTSDESKVAVVARSGTECTAGTSTIRAGNVDLHDESSDENREEQLKEKQFLFLKKCFEELRTRKHIPNYCERFDEETSREPKKFEEISCVCHLEENYEISEDTKEVKEQLTRQETTALSDISTESQIDPFAEHCTECNISRLNDYFRAIAEYFTEERSHPDLFILDPDTTSVDYRYKAMREIRKIMALKLWWGLEAALEEWEECMTKEDTEKLEKRNNIREFLHFVLNNMLEALIGPDESLSEEEEEEEYDEDDLFKNEYLWLKKLRKKLNERYQTSHARRKFLIQEAVLDGYYPLVKENNQIIPKKVSAIEDEIKALRAVAFLSISSEEETEQEEEEKTEQEEDETNEKESKETENNE